MKQLKYHQKTLNLLNKTHEYFTLAPIWLNNLETELGCKLPASFREWYSIENVHEILHKHSNQDHPISLKDLGRKYKFLEPIKANELDSHPLLMFMWENQGVCQWGIHLNDDDDPPVYVRWNATTANWQKACDHFSDFIYSWIWDWSKTEYSLNALCHPLKQADLDYLAAHFQPQNTTQYWPDPNCIQHRFYKNDQKILVWNCDNLSDWYIWADNANSLLELTCVICAQVNISEALGIIGAADELSTVLEKLQVEFGKPPET